MQIKTTRLITINSSSRGGADELATLLP